MRHLIYPVNHSSDRAVNYAFSPNQNLVRGVKYVGEVKCEWHAALWRKKTCFFIYIFLIKQPTACSTFNLNVNKSCFPLKLPKQDS